jgi:ribose transport system permease protein
MSVSQSAPPSVSDEPKRRPRPVAADGGWTLTVLGRFGLPLLLLVVVATFSLLKPDSFFAWTNFQSTFSSQAIILMVALGAMVTLIVGEFDLSIGANAGLAAIFAVGLGDNQHVNAWLALLAAVAIATAIGALNGIIVTKLKVNSFVATLGMATAIAGVGQLYTHETDLQSAPQQLIDIGRTEILGLQMTVIVAIVVAALMLVALQYLAIGRRLLAVGANRRAARLTGIGVDGQVIGAFAAGGLVAGLGGALYGANLGGASNATGATLLLPAFAGAFLGSTAIYPGRFNVIGTVVAVLLLAFTITGLEQVGVQPWIQSIVQGFALVGAVAFSSWAIRLRAARLRISQLRLISEEAANDAAAADVAAADAPPETRA